MKKRKRLERDEGKEDQRDRKIVLLFLAHDGIAQVEFWEEWIKSSGLRDRILFYVVTQHQDKVPQKKMWHGVVVAYPLRWCDMSQVWALQRGLQRILRDDITHSVTCIYFLSGSEIPATSATYLYHAPDRTRFCLAPNPPRLDVLQPKDARDWKTVIKLFDDYYETVFSTRHHMASFSMTTPDALKIANFPFRKLKALEKILKRHPFPWIKTRDSYQRAMIWWYPSSKRQNSGVRKPKLTPFNTIYMNTNERLIGPIRSSSKITKILLCNAQMNAYLIGFCFWKVQI